MTLHQIIDHGAVVHTDAETDILICWDGGIHFKVFAGTFDGNYDYIDDFYQGTATLAAAKAACKMWFDKHATFNPGP